MRVIPAIDILNGKCVRLSQGDYSQSKIYAEDPVEVAKKFEAHGIQYLHVVDLDGARSKHIVNYKTLESICTNTNLKVDFGGGLKSSQDLQIAFACGVEQITAGSVAVSNPNLVKAWLERYGSEKIILGADCKDRKICTQGWKQDSDIDVVQFIQDYINVEVQYVVCTDISKDGMLSGPAFELYQEILKQTSIKLIASGGISNLEELIQLKELGCMGAILGKAIYEDKISLKELSQLC